MGKPDRKRKNLNSSLRARRYFIQNLFAAYSRQLEHFGLKRTRSLHFYCDRNYVFCVSAIVIQSKRAFKNSFSLHVALSVHQTYNYIIRDFETYGIILLQANSHKKTIGPNHIFILENEVCFFK